MYCRFWSSSNIAYISAAVASSSRWFWAQVFHSIYSRRRKSYHLENSFYELIKILQSWDDTKLWCNNNSGVFWTKGCCPRLQLLQNLEKEIDNFFLLKICFNFLVVNNLLVVCYLCCICFNINLLNNHVSINNQL